MTDRELLNECLALKELHRAGWKRVGVAEPESVADHSFGVALAALVLAPPELDRGRLLAMALLHDLAEVRVGDITPHDGVSPQEKTRREADAAARLFEGHPQLAAIWLESEQGVTAEARFLKAMDTLDLHLQAERYGDRGYDTSEFGRAPPRAAR
ncbi:MAG: HD domain-containing protein [Myxococcales bacterium]|nr:HD domain-containing protein [Myxococcales bacterium]